MKNFRPSRRAFSRLLVVLLCAAFGLSFTACAPKPPAFEPQPGVTYTKLLDAMNRQVADGLAEEMPGLQWSGLVGDHITLCGNGQPDPDTGVAPYLLATLEPDGESYTSLPLTLPPVAEDLPQIAAALQDPAPHVEGQAYDRAIRSVAGVVQNATQQVYVLLEEGLLHTDEAEENHMTQLALTLCGLGADGVLQPGVRLQLPQDFSPDVIVGDLFWGSDDTLWLTLEEYAFDGSDTRAALLCFAPQDGGLVRRLDLPQGMTCRRNAVAHLTGNRLLVLASESTQTPHGPGSQPRFLLAEGLTMDKPSWQTPLTPPQEITDAGHTFSVIPQLTDSGNAVLLNADSSVLCWYLDEERAETLFQWSEFAIDPYKLNDCFAVGDGRYLVNTYESGTFTQQLRLLTPLDPTAVTERTVLTLALSYAGLYTPDTNLRETINRFNATSTEYYVEIVDWGDRYITQNVLNQEMPDIVMIRPTSLSLLNKGIFLDLYPFIDADPELSREDFQGSILALTEVDGQLPTIVASYNLRTVFGASDEVGEQPGWTLQDLYRLCQQNPTPFFDMEGGPLLVSIVQSGSFVDWEAGQAHFDTPEFVELLQFCATQPVAADDDGTFHPQNPKPLREEGKPLLLWQDLYGWGDVSGPRYVYDGAYTIKGFPSVDGSTSGQVAWPIEQFAISYTCEHPQAAWEVLRCLLLPAYQDKIGETNFGFPLRRSSLQAQAQAAQENAPAHGTAGTYFTFEERLSDPSIDELDRQPLTKEETDKVLAAIEQVDALWSVDSTVTNILSEEFEYFLGGVRNAEQTAAMVQDRVQTYLDE